MHPKQLAEKLKIPYTENHDHEQVLAEYYKKNGRSKVHLCREWDFMAIHSESPEFDACLCDVTKLP